MTTMLDRLFRYGYEVHRDEREIVQAALRDMQDAIVLDISNVASYFYSASNGGKDWMIGDFPNIAPAFETAWVMSSAKFGTLPGFLLAVIHKEIGEGESYIDLSEVEFSDGPIADEGFAIFREPPPEVRWQREMLAFSPSGVRMVPLAFCLDYINEDGTPHLVEGKPRNLWRPLWVDESYQAKKDAVVVAGRLMSYPYNLAASFMHCKNVELNEYEPPRKLSKRYEKRHGVPLTSYYTLTIDPMKKVLKHEGGKDQGGLSKALHICRGHFKTYTEDKPLFGRLSGTYWWPQHARGTEERGTIVKDYSVKPFTE